MTRMIERWFPCQEVSENSEAGWGSGNSEKNLFTWFAARPLVQAKAAVICSLLPWPDEPGEQRRLQQLVRDALTGRDAKHDELVAELRLHYPDGPSLLDPFSGRAMIPLEAARLGVKAWGIDYSPVATLAGALLADYPLRNWDSEPPLPFDGYVADDPEHWGMSRLLRDVEFVLHLIRARYEEQMDRFYPKVDGKRPWGYLWAVTLPCQNCGRRFPLTGSLVLRQPVPKKNDPGQAYRIVTDLQTSSFWAEVHPGPPLGTPTIVSVAGKRGKSGVCPFCEQVHSLDVLTRLMNDNVAEDALLVVADIDDGFGKVFRSPTVSDLEGATLAEKQVAQEPEFAPALPAIPNEQIPPGNNDTVRPSKYGYRTYGALCNARQTLGFIRLAATVNAVVNEIRRAGASPDYAAAIAGYCASVMVRRLRRATRGARLQVTGGTRVGDLFINESSIGFSYDHFESGCGAGPGTWGSVMTDTIAALRTQLDRPTGEPARIIRASALALPLPNRTLDAVVTDPPYDSMIDYTDASDLFYVWLKRALVSSQPDIAITANPLGVQEKDDEIIVKRGGKAVDDHRNDAFYDRAIAAAFSQARHKVKDEGVVTIVFGHGDPDVWHRLLTSVDQAELVLTGSWPARTESGGKAGSANIETTLTLACRPAPPDRKPGRVTDVDAEVRHEIEDRMPLWEAAGLALTDQLMASAGPAMEVVGRYSQILNKLGDPVALDRYLPLARRFVEEAADIRIDALPLDTFDPRTRFALFWVRLFARQVAPGSEARWQRLAFDLEDSDTAGIIVKVEKGVRLACGSESHADVRAEAAVIDVALALAKAGKSAAGAAAVLLSAGRVDDAYLWAALGDLSARLPEADPDGDVWTWLVRNKKTVIAATENVEAAQVREREAAESAKAQGNLFGEER